MTAVPSPEVARSQAVPLLATIAAIAALYLGRDLLAPLALAGLLAFLLTPLAGRIERLRVGRGFAAAAAVLVLLVGVAGPLYVVVQEGINLSRELPSYRDNIRRKLTLIESISLTEPLREATQEMPLLEPDGASSERRPMEVQVVERPRGALAGLVSILGPLAPLLAGTVIVLLLTTILIAFRTDVRERFVRLVGRGELALTTQALDDASRRVARFLAATLLVNGLFAVPVTVGLLVLGVPNALLWGVVAALLRFIPLVGVWIGALFPLAIVFAVYDDWWRTGAILGLFGLTDLLVSNVAEPLVFGRRTGVASVAVVLSTLFWTWLWGIPGLLLAMPLTVCLAVVGRHVPGLGFLDVLLGAASALSPSQRFYQCLLMFDPARAGRQLDDAVVASGLDPVLDQIVMPALSQASADRRSGALDVVAFEQVCASARDLVDARVSLSADGLEAVAARPAGPGGLPSILLVPVADAADGAAAEILGARLSALGIASDVAPVSALGGEIAARVERLHPPLVVLVGLPPLAEGRVRYLAKRLRGVVQVGQLIGLAWQPTGTVGESQPGLSEATDHTFHDMTQATNTIRSLLDEGQQRLDLLEAAPRNAAPAPARQPA